MNDNLLRRIKTKLNAKFYIMNDSWLRECLDFFIRDKAPHEVCQITLLFLILIIHIIKHVFNNRFESAK